MIAVAAFPAAVAAKQKNVVTQIIISKKETVLITVCALTEVDLVKLNEVFWLCFMEGRAL